MDYTKLAPALIATYARYQQSNRTRGPLVPHSHVLGIESVREEAKPLRVVVSLECDPDAVLDGTLGDEIELNQGGRRVRTAIVPLDQLQRLSAHPGIKRIVPATRLRPLLNLAQEKIEVPQFRTENSLTGKDVVVGVVDSGIDPLHPAFTGRIERIWDQTMLGGTGVPEGRYGAEFTNAGMAMATLSRDTHGHGTHVTGIAAGTEGVAPQARIVMVKTDFQDAHIVDGIQYVFRVARDLGLPAVVNLSLGGHFDPHDGTDPMSLAIGEESGPGRIVCCAAGNEGDDDLHARFTVREGAVRSVPCHAGSLAGEPDVFWLNGWYAGSDRLEIAVEAPSGAATPFQPVKTTGSPEQTFELPDGTVQIVTPGPDPANHDHNFVVVVEPGGFVPAPVPGRWRLLVRTAQGTSGPVEVDTWILGRPDARPQPQFSGPAVHDAIKIGSPGCAASAITVAAYTTRRQWQDIDGNQRVAPALVLDDIASFSSEGPLRNGAAKPDITAPGAMIISALSRDARTMQRALITGPGHVAMQGTSMATPVVTGIAALLLQRDPGCDPRKFLDLLRANAAVPGGTPGAFDPKWGHGLIKTANL